MARRLTEGEKAEMVRLRAKGLSYSAIVQETGRSMSAVYGACNPEAKANKQAAAAAYFQSPEGKEAHRASQAKYRQSPNGRAKRQVYQKAYNQLPEAKARAKAHRQKPARKAAAIADHRRDA